MQAWVLDEVHGSLRRAEVPVPVPGPGQVRVQVRASGLCHTDVGYMQGVIKLATSVPLILGHEVSGVIDALGEGVSGWAVGDRIVGALSVSDAPGVTRDGAYAEQVLLTADQLVAVPEALDWAQAATATDAGVTSYTAVVVYGGIKAGDRVGIVGLGGLGMVGAQIAVARGATVYGAEPREEVWQRAVDLGVVEVFTDVSGFEGLDLNVIVDFAGFGTTTAGAIEAVGRQGRVVLVGMGSSEVTFDSNHLVNKAVELRGVVPTGDPAHLQAVIDMMSAGTLAVQTETITFDDIPEGLRRLERGQVAGRLVAAVS